MNKHLIIGYGEVGQALANIIKSDIADLTLSEPQGRGYEVMHISFGYSHKFIAEVKRYQKLYRPKLTIIHSTVPVGTSKKCKSVHSPVRGVHPNLELGLKTFVKYFGGKEAKKAARYFQKAGIKVRCYDGSETTEAIKLWETTQYGWLIMLEKEIYQWCKKNGLDFEEVYRSANRDYNEGYEKLGKREVVRPYLTHCDGPIGGHCVIANSYLLDSNISNMVIKFNNKLKKPNKSRGL